LSTSLGHLSLAGLKEISRIGESIAKIMLQLHETGSHPWLEEMRHEAPPGLLEMLNVPGLPADKIIICRKTASSPPGLRSRIERVLESCAGNDVAVEINCNPLRLELDWQLHRQALALGCVFSIDPDAHSVLEIGLMRWGVNIARKVMPRVQKAEQSLTSCSPFRPSQSCGLLALEASQFRAVAGT
jgi:hypothetical protein